jgi:hypothetical protein
MLSTGSAMTWIIFICARIISVWKERTVYEL